MSFLHAKAKAGEVVTGLLYLDKDAEDLHANLKTVKTPLNRLGTANCARVLRRSMP